VCDTMRRIAVSAMPAPQKGRFFRQFGAEPTMPQRPPSPPLSPLSGGADLFAWAEQLSAQSEPSVRSRSSASGRSTSPTRRSAKPTRSARSALAHVRLSPAERAEMEEAAAAFHVSLSDLIRAGALNLARQDAALLPQEARAVARAAGALAESGRALAQMSALLHAGAPAPLEALIAIVESLRVRVDALTLADQALLAVHRGRAAKARRLLRRRDDGQVDADRSDGAA
jgi:hypothetical protein